MLLVVPLAAAETDSLTLKEWDALLARRLVLFEDASHPLRSRLDAAGIATDVMRTTPRPEGDVGVVIDPGSALLVELAKTGAEVTSGVATTPDALTAAHGAYLTRRGAASLTSLALVMARLRSPDGCPWDQEQTHGSLRVHLLEEAYEVLEAIDADQLGDELEEELGDLLLQVAFHAQLAADDGRFDLAGVADRIAAKLLHRHPHVFGDTNVADASEVVRNWESIKKEEKERSGPFDGVPGALPALLAAYKIQKRAASLGFRPSADEARERLDAALSSKQPDLGEALFWLVALARADGVDPEGALRAATTSFRRGYEEDAKSDSGG